MSPATKVFDPILAEIFRHALTAIPGQIDANIVHTAYSPLIYEYKDYAVGIVDDQGCVLSQSQGALPIFVANAMGIAARDALSIHGRDGFAPGDILISNHSGTLGQHLNNVVMMAPIFVGEGQQSLFGFMTVVAHWLDVGGKEIGSGSLDAVNIFQEGVQYRCVKLLRGGQRDEAMFATILANTRFPRELGGDLRAQLAGCVRGAEMVRALVDRYGEPSARLAVARMWDSAEAASRAAITDIADGDYFAESFLDDDGVRDGEPIRVALTVRVAGDTMDIDLSECADQTVGPINSGREGGAVAAARIAFKYLVHPREPANEGAFRPLSVTIREGTFLSAGPTAPMSLYSAPLPTVVDTILKAMAPALPERIAAAHHGTFGVHMFVGVDPETGELFQNLDTALGGWGASSDSDGGGPFKTMAHGDTLDVPVEAQEALYPLRIETFALRPDSGGAGRHRGGLGLAKIFVADAPCTVLVAQDREKSPPWGLFGGQQGAIPRTWLHRPGESPVEVRRKSVALQRGDRLIVHSGGGGGYGDPGKRDRDAVRDDVANGYVSAEAAKAVYGLG